MTATRDWLQAPELATFGAFRRADPADTIDGTPAAIVIEPHTPEQMAAAVAWASRERLSTVIRGRGTKLGWGRPPRTVDVVLSTIGLTTLVAHRHGDLTATVQAGATLTDLNRQLAAHGQWLPVDTAFAAATIGGLIATNDAGPLRHRYGTPRDLLIGITLALTDGRLVRSGGHVVKNVAGYDLGKLMSGSFGGLAVIVDATFKLLPIPPASQTVVADYHGGAQLARDVAALAASQLEPVAFDLRVSTNRAAGWLYQLFVRFATSPAATSAQVGAARALLTGDVSVETGDRDAALWAEQARRPWTAGGDAVVRCSWLPASLAALLELLAEMHGTYASDLELTGRAAVGAGFLRIGGSDDATGGIVERLRATPAIVANVAVLQQSRSLKQRVDPWGPPGSTAGVLRALKQAFDPAGILNAGRGPG